MSSLHRQSSTTSSDVKWLYDQVTFENIADQYVQGKDVTVVFTLSQSLTTNFDRDEIGITPIGCINIKECLAFAPIQIQASDSVIRGTATFAASNLSANDDKFYQFCYIRNKSKNLGLSKPFQLNYTLDDIDYLSDIPTMKTGTDALLSLSDQENDDIILINTESDAKKGKLRESECSQYDERCRTLESINEKNLDELNRIRSQWSVATQFAKDQATQILDLERRLIQANQLLKKSNEEKLSLERQLRDLRLTSEKYQRSAEGQIKHLSATSDPKKLLVEQQLRDLSLTSEKYQRSAEGQIKHLSATSDPEKFLLEQQLRDLRLNFEKYQLSTEAQLKFYSRQDDRINELENTNRLLQEKLVRLQTKNQSASNAVSFDEDNELKGQLNVYQKFINDLQYETKRLTERLSSQNKTQNSVDSGEVQQCPVCYFHFPPYFTLNQKNEHIHRHF